MTQITTHEIAIYGQQCQGIAGSWCREPERDYGDDWRDADDLSVYSGTRDELIQQAADLDALVDSGRIGAGTDTYYRKVARTIREAVE